MIRSKCVYSPIDRDRDGLRILATRFRGRGMSATRYDVWMATLGPSEGLLAEAQSGKFTLGAGHRRKAHRGSAGRIPENFLQFEQAGEETLAGICGRARMMREKLRQQRGLVAGARVVFHRARAERIELGVDREIEPRQPCVMTYRVELGDFGQARRRIAQMRIGNRAQLGYSRRRLRQLLTRVLAITAFT